MPSSTLDRIEALVAKYAAAKNVTMQVGPALGIASEVAPLLPLLREWLAARVQYQTATSTPEYECARRVEAAGRALAAALRREP